MKLNGEHNCFSFVLQQHENRNFRVFSRIRDTKKRKKGLDMKLDSSESADFHHADLRWSSESVSLIRVYKLFLSIMDATSADVLERKVFFIQSKLVESVPIAQVKKALSEAQLWLQPRHYFEIIEERSNDSMCGYPACGNTILKPSDVSSILKISYKEKRLYEIGRSKLFCCSDCLQKSAIFEASLSEAHPASREVATAFLLRSKENNTVCDTLQSDYFSSASASTVNSCTGHETDYSEEKRSTSPPKFHNPQLTVGGAAIILSEDTEKKNVTCLNDKGQTMTSAVSPSVEIESHEVLESHITEEADATVPQKSAVKKKVGFVDLKSLESSVGEKWVDTKNTKSTPQKSSTKKSLLKPFDYNDISKIDIKSASVIIGGISEKLSSIPDPVVNGNTIDSPITDIATPRSTSIKGNTALEGKNNIVTTATSSGLLSVIEDEEEEDETDEDSEESDEDEEGDSSIRAVEEISLFIMMWTTLDDLFGESILSICSISSSAVNSHSSSASTPEDVLNTTITSGSVQSQGHASTAITPNSFSTECYNRSAEDDIIEERKPIDPALLASRRSVAMFVERGFISAEASCGLSRYLTREHFARYNAVKGELLNSIGQSSSVCPKLNSSEFSLLALLAIDAIVVNQMLLPLTSSESESAEDNWSETLRTSTTQILRKRAGRRVQQEQSRSLREGDLELLRNFFPRKLL